MPPRRDAGKPPSRRAAVTAALVASHALLFVMGVNWARLRDSATSSSVLVSATTTPATVSLQSATASVPSFASVAESVKVAADVPAVVKAAPVTGGSYLNIEAQRAAGTHDLLYYQNFSRPPLPQEAVDKVARDKFIIYTWTNFHMRDFLMNWILWLKAHGITEFLIGALDVELETYLKAEAPALGIRIAVLSLNSGLTTGDYGWNTPSFKRMAKYKFLPVQRLLTAGVDVLVCDTDTVWMKNPMPYFKETPEPDILTSTDVLRQLPLKEQLQSTLNIGIMVFRSRPPSIQFVDTFYNEMVDDPAFGTGNAEWDQSRFNRMARAMHKVREGSSMGPQDKPWIEGWNRKVKVQALNIVDFPNGHVMFAQQLPQKLGITPMIVHATFQYGGTWGKRHRFREWRMWLADEPAYYDPPGGLLYYTPNVPADLIEKAKVPKMETHFDLLNFQLLQLRSAWAIARVLNRVLIMPAFICGMDRVWFPHSGVFPGSDPLFTIPFTPCPMDHILDPETMDKRGMLAKVREFSVLSNEKMPQAVLNSIVHVDWLPAGSAANDMSIVDTEGTVKLFPGIKEKEIKALLKPFESRKIIHFKSMPGGSASFGGFDTEESWKEFEEDMRRIPAMWCCIDQHEAQQRGQPFPPGQTWYDLLWDIIPHTDRFGRTWTDKWSIKLGP